MCNSKGFNLILPSIRQLNPRQLIDLIRFKVDKYISKFIVPEDVICAKAGTVEDLE